MDVTNVEDILIKNCVFHNCSTNTEKPQFHGNSGAVSISYFPVKASDNASFFFNQLRSIALISDCIFTDNQAILPPGISESQLTEALNNNTYHGRGGGLGIYVQENIRNVSVKIQDCLFENNFADSFGGGLYLNIDGQNSTHYFTVERSNFTRNSVAGDSSYGGAVQVALLIQNIDFLPTEITFRGCYFEGNHAAFGGGLSTVQVDIYIV